MNKPYFFSGTSLNRPQIINRPNKLPETLNPYIPDTDLVQAVNVALLLKRPLLLMGEPGSGKSQLARALAHELYHKVGPANNALTKEDRFVKFDNGAKHTLQQDYLDFYEEWNINSNAKAKEGLYEYDAIQRLGDAQSKARIRLDKKKYIRLGPMGRAIQRSNKDQRIVLLIDEIDKADLDFSNDLLNELDRSSFTITETGKTIQAQTSPIVIITSNGEKELADAFLRRCVFHRIEPFSADKLKDIVRRRFFMNLLPEPNNAPHDQENIIDNINEEQLTDADKEKLVKEATARFIEIRQKIKSNQASTGSKSVSTAEFLDWFDVLNYYRYLKTDDPIQQAMIDDARKIEAAFPAFPFKQALLKHSSMLSLFKENSKS